ncbi:MAM and LDL-receptor class A domain-containing protein 1-like [Oculina patagonica]
MVVELEVISKTRDLFPSKQLQCCKVTFEGIVGSNFRGDLAIDDVSISSGRCPAAFCDFDSGLCSGWRQSNSDVFDWTRHTGSTLSSDTGPDYDHTNGSGHYMYIETSSPRVAGDNAKLELPVSANDELACLEFYYHMYGDTMGTLNVFNGNAVVFSKSGNHGANWIKEEITIYLDNTVTFEGIAGSSWRGDLAIDDVSISSGSCQGHTATLTLSTASKLTSSLPLVSTTLNPSTTNPSFSSGSSMLDSSTAKPSLSSGSSMLDSSTAKPSLSSWSSTLNLSSAKPSLSSGSSMLDSSTPKSSLSSGSSMLDSSTPKSSLSSGSSTLNPSTPKSSLSSGSSTLNPSTPKSSLSSASSTLNPSTPKSSLSSESSTLHLSTAKPSLSPVATSCDFDSGLCSGWQQSNSDVFDWTSHTGSTLSSNTGPDYDHTSGSGYYMFIETSSPRVAGDNAKLELPSSGNGGLSCLEFYYHMYGDTIGTLNVFSGNAVVFNRSGNHGNVWIKEEITIYLNNTVTFEGIRGSSWTGDLAIDDVSITNGSCQVHTSVPTFSTASTFAPSLSSVSTTLYPSTAKPPMSSGPWTLTPFTSSASLSSDTSTFSFLINSASTYTFKPGFSKSPITTEPPSLNETGESVILKVKGMDIKKWNEPMKFNFKRKVARVASDYCAVDGSRCLFTSKRYKNN